MTDCWAGTTWSQTDPDEILVDVSEIQYESRSVAIARGRADNGDRITFAGEPRVLHAVHEMLELGEVGVWTLVPPWAIMRRDLAG